MSNRAHSELIDRLFQQHVKLEPGEPIMVTPEEFRQLERIEIERQMLMDAALAEYTRRMKEIGRELGITTKPNFLGREIRVAEPEKRSKEEIRAEISYEISQCLECKENMRLAYMSRPRSLFWEECPKHREALRRLDVPEQAEDDWRVGSKVPINVYQGERSVCQCHTTQDAAAIVAAMNAETRHWKHIDTAPRDGTPILACDAGCPRDADRFTCYWNEGLKEWALMRPGMHCVSDDIEPTHWMPLPEPPSP